MSVLLPSALYPVAAVRALDAAAIEGGIPGLVLMQRAGQAAWQLALRRWPAATRLCVVCGPGNNGGDGYVVAREALAAGREVTLIEVGDCERSSADALACRAAALAAGLRPQKCPASFASADLIIDAIFGIGLTRPPADEFRLAIETINAAAVPVLSLDVPSGLNADTGFAPGVQVNVSVTGLFTPRRLSVPSAA